MDSDEKKNASRENNPRITRRTVLQGAGLAAAAAAFPLVKDAVAVPQEGPPQGGGRGPGAGGPPPEPPQSIVVPGGVPGEYTSADYPVSDVMMKLSTYISQARDQALPDDLLEKAKFHILDTMAAMVSGSELLPGRAVHTFMASYGGKPTSTVVADTILCGPIEAAMVNGTLAHADETDDTVAPGPWHPGCVVVPATLAVGEQFGINGMQFLRAVVLGYDVGCRAIAAITPGPPGNHRLSYAYAGAFGACAAASCAAGLNAEQVRTALSYTAQQTSGLESFPRDPDHIEKGFIFAGMPSRSGVTAVLLTHAGWTAVHDIMSGPDNFLSGNSPNPKPELLIDKLGETYYLNSANLKRWTVGAPVQTLLDTLEAMLKKQPIDPSQIQEIVIRSAPGSITDNSGAPDINQQYAMAVMLIDKTATFKAIHDKARMHDPQIVKLRAMMRLNPGPPGGRGRGAAAGPALPLIQITLTDGTRLTADAPGPSLGTAQNPMNRDQVVAKARDLMTPVLGASQTMRLIDRTLELENVKTVLELRSLLQRKYVVGPPKLSDYPSAKA